MKLRIIVICLLLAASAACIGLCVYAFLSAQYVGGGVAAGFAVLGVLSVVGVALQGSLISKCDKLFVQRRYEEAKEVVDRAAHGPFYPLVRMTVLQFYYVIAAALDDIPLAKQTIERLRNGGGLGWKYRTAYVYILIKLDEGDEVTAHKEYSDFRTHNENVELYREQITVLDALFARLFTRSDAPLPAAVENSHYPVVQRILGKHFEQRAEAEGWN